MNSYLYHISVILQNQRLNNVLFSADAVSQSEIRSLAVESAGRQKCLPPSPLSFYPPGHSVWSAKCAFGFAQKGVDFVKQTYQNQTFRKFDFGTRGRTRTGTPARAMDFESIMSTNSITLARPAFYSFFPRI